MRLIYLSPLPWASFSQRPHHFVDWFHKRTGCEVLWVDPYPARFPNFKDLQRKSSVTLNAASHSTPSWLSILKPNALPLEPLPGSGWINCSLWSEIVSQAVAFAAEEQTHIFIGKPSLLALNLLKRLPNCCSTYDAMDDFPAFHTGLSSIAMRRREQLVAAKVQTIMTSSSVLKEKWEHFCSDVRLVGNGLSLGALTPHIHTMDTKKIEEENTQSYVFGYVGTVGSWFDWHWILRLAESRPSDEVRIIGPIYQQPAFQLPQNVYLLPALDHSSAIAAMTKFDVGVIPFKKNLLTDSVDPIKYYEYRGLGLPVLSTVFGEMSLRGAESGVYLTYSYQDVPTQTNLAIRFLTSAEERDDFLSKNNWESRFDAANLLNHTSW